MNRKNRYCCLLIPCDIKKECDYFEIELQIKELKKIVDDINKAMMTDFDSSTAKIDSKYGIIMYDNTLQKNQYISKLGGINKKGMCLLISHIENFDKFLKTFDINIYEKYMKYISHNSTLCIKMILLCIFYITSENNLS